MKKLLVSLAAIALLGAGCLPVANAPVEGKWSLAFTLPSGWVMVTPYEVPGEGKAKPLNEQVRRDASEVYLQSVGTPLCWSSGGPCAEGSTSEGTQIRATILDSHRKLDTSSLTDLGHGFYVKAGSAAPADGPELLNRDTFYYVSDKATYQFQFIGDESVVKPVILSAKVVTHFTDIPPVEVQTK